MISPSSATCLPRPLHREPADPHPPRGRAFRARRRLQLLALTCLVFLGLSTSAQAIVYTYENTTSGTIPELGSNGACNGGTALVRTFTVSESFTVSTIALGLNVTHSDRGQIRAILNAPGGSSAVFLTQTGDGDNNYDIMISSNSEGAVDDNDVDPTGAPYFNRLVSLGGADFYTGNANGTWTLRICDRDTAGGLGTFNRARLVLTSTATVTSPCTSTVSFDWGANGDFTAFTNTTVGDITITQGTTTDYAGVGTSPLFVTRTSTTGAHPGWYGMAMDSAGSDDSEGIGLSTTFSFSRPISALTFMTMDIDAANNSWEDQVHVFGFDSGGNRIPFSMVNSVANEPAGDWVEGDASIPSTSSDANITYVFAGAVSSVQIEYTQGDNPATGTSFMFIGVSDFGFCAYDFGDAPSSYSTILGGGARHVLGSRNLYLGSTAPDGEGDGQAVGAGADNNGANGDGTDEDGVASFPSASSLAGVYTVTVVASNATGSAANLCGWIDFDQGGTFDSDEGSCVTVPASGSNASCTSTGGSGYSCTVSFTVPTADRGNSGNFYGRFRVTTDSLTTSQPGGVANDGEVEDYQIPITTLPVTLGYVETRDLGGSVEVRFTTATETANAGFEILGRAEGGPWQLLARLPSRADGSLRPQSYRRVVAPAKGSATGAIDEIALVDRDYRGRSRMHGPFEIGVAYGQPVAIDAVDWAAVKSATGTRGPLEVMRATSSASQTLAAPFVMGGADTGVGARLLIAEEGLHRVTYEQLAAAGADFAGNPSSSLALVDAGKSLQRYVDCGPVFGPGCAIEFLGRPETTLASPVDVYTLSVDPKRAIAVVEETSSVTTAPVGVYPATLVQAQDRRYNFASPNGDPWYDQALLSFGSAVTVQRTFDLPGLVAGPAQLHLDLWGVTDFPGLAQDHHLVVRLNGSDLADERFDGLTVWQRTFDAGSLLQASGNVLELEVPGDTGQPFDLIHLERFEVSFPGQTLASDGRWQGRSSAGGAFSVAGLSGAPAVVWARVGGTLRRTVLQPQSVAGGAVVTSPWGDQKSWLAEEGSFLTPGVEAGIPAPATATNAQYLVITHPAFADHLDALLDLQARRGLSTAVVTTDAIYAAYSDHAADPEAIRRQVAASAKSGRLRFVLIVGGDTYDPYDHLGLGSVSFVPTTYVRISDLVAFAPADDRAADVNGDGVPDVAFGRLPVRTPQELEAVVDKLWDWELRGESSKALLATGRSDQQRELADLTDGFITALGKSWQTSTAYVDDLGRDGTRGMVRTALDRGTPLISYLGHSSYGQWDFEPLLTWQEVAGLNNAGKPSIITQWGCWNSYYVSPEVQTLSSHLLLTPRVGAAGTIGSTTLTSSGSHEELGARFFAAVGGGATTLGEALLKAKRQLAVVGGADDAVAGMALLGDPATPVGLKVRPDFVK